VELLTWPWWTTLEHRDLLNPPVLWEVNTACRTNSEDGAELAPSSRRRVFEDPHAV
jgi:hypothetical protein